ncbi:MAG: transglutaminase-like domain-containing protein, partial [Bacillota bacterium]|nr:transglutaminase-like domain-containing protein [Bacillota bacterium]
TYTLNAPAAPEGKDFVDYFLFENKRGYCVYFATALSVMCRIAGIPSRYVEGYKMSNNGTSGTKQEVTNEMAHAWIEYMAGDDIWVLADCSPTPYENEQAPTQQAVTTSDPSNPNSATSDPKTTPNVNPTGGNTGGSNNTPTIKSSGTHKVVVYSSLASAGFIALAAFLVLLIRRRRKMFHGESLVPLHSYMHKRLRRYKIIKGSTETEKEFALKQEEELRNILYPLVNKLYDEFYGGIRDKTIDKKEIYLAFERHLKKRQNKLVYYLKKCY